MAGLIDAINMLPRRLALGGGERLDLPKRYYSAGFVAALAAFLRHKNLDKDSFGCHHEYNEGYLKAIGLSKAVWGTDDYKLRRINAGETYAPLTHLQSRDAVDEGTGQINGCLRTMAKSSSVNYLQSPAFAELLAVVGELHDNVWSHGLDSGFSTAQRRTCPKDGPLIEFSLADCGMGFRNELQRARVENIATDRDAIDWCIQKGNSSKLAAKEDPWAQSVPEDFLGGRPFGNGVTTFQNTGNHHQGLGLAKLLSLAKQYDGLLYLASGDHYLELQNGIPSYRELSHPWQGVAISLAIKESSFVVGGQPIQDVDSDDVFELMNALRG
ncbi:hypothetical protein [Pseudomonas alloputida]|uniref:hypothetical protein n=1 Tax=Pseudomonas alloputida TaxID=1940621 RepID=UPI00320A1E25